MDWREHQLFMEEGLNLSQTNFTSLVIDAKEVEDNFADETAFHRAVIKFEQSLKN